MWKCLFDKGSRDHGTLGHLCSLLGRLPHANVPKNDLHACLDALLTVFKGHAVATACEILGIEHPAAYLPDSVSIKKGEKEQRAFLNCLSEKVVNHLLPIETCVLGNAVEESGDAVYNYAIVLCHYAALVLEFTDAWSEGDGVRVLRCWKVFLFHFHSQRRTKYALEALCLQFQLATLPPDLVHHLTWGRFINTHGTAGHNIPCDLHNEHINKIFKDIIGNMGANFTEEASTIAARAVTSLATISVAFDKNSGIHPEASAHSTRSDMDEVTRVVSIIKRNNVLCIKPGRYHSNFPKISLNSISWPKLNKWIKEKVKERTKFRSVMGEGNISDEEPSDSES